MGGGGEVPELATSALIIIDINQMRKRGSRVENSNDLKKMAKKANLCVGLNALSEVKARSCTTV
jgi:hypothetical protein